MGSSVKICSIKVKTGRRDTIFGNRQLSNYKFKTRFEAGPYQNCWRTDQGEEGIISTKYQGPPNNLFLPSGSPLLLPGECGHAHHQLPSNVLLTTLITQTNVGGKTYDKSYHLEHYKLRRKLMVTDTTPATFTLGIKN